MSNTLRIITGKVDIMQERINNVSRERKTLRQNKKYARNKKH